MPRQLHVGVGTQFTDRLNNEPDGTTIKITSVLPSSDVNKKSVSADMIVIADGGAPTTTLLVGSYDVAPVKNKYKLVLTDLANLNKQYRLIIKLHKKQADQDRIIMRSTTLFTTAMTMPDDPDIESFSRVNNKINGTINTGIDPRTGNFGNRAMQPGTIIIKTSGGDVYAYDDNASLKRADDQTTVVGSIVYSTGAMTFTAGDTNPATADGHPVS